MQTELTPEALRYLDRVVCDGRYVESFQENPRPVAGNLGLDLSQDAVGLICSRDPDDLLNDLYKHRFAPEAVRPHPYIIHNAPNADLGATVLIGILAGTVVTGIAAMVIFWGKSSKKVEDKSGEEKD